MTKHHTFTTRLAPACILVTLAVTGCGSDDTTLTEAQYRTQANEVCAKAEEKLAPIFGEIFPKLDTATEDERMTATNGLLEVLGKEIDDLAALEPPESMSKDVDAMLASVRKAEGIVKEQGAGFWLDESDPFGDVNQRAADLGLDACAGDSQE